MLGDVNVNGTFLVIWILLQLYGGIQRYLEQFPDGGFFKGKNFVFDHRCGLSFKTSLHLNLIGFTSF